MAARVVVAVSVGLASASLAVNATGAPHERGGTDQADSFDLAIHSETYGELFQRALLPGASGTIVETRTAAPLYEFVSFQVHDVDTSWQKDSVDLELTAFSRVWFGERDETVRRLDGDVQSANVRYHHGPLSLRLGRQLVAGGAAGYARFDGVALGATFGGGFAVEGYAGFTVLPRWDERPGYYHLGAAADSLLREPDALPEPERSGWRLGGGRVGWSSTRAQAAVSFHQQDEDSELARRSFAVDGRAYVFDQAALGTNAVFELDALGVREARIWLDVAPTPRLDFSAEVLHTEPALFLSRQSVLSVFSTDAYEEAGGSTVLRLTDRFGLEAGGWIDFYEDSQRGARGEVGARFTPGTKNRTLVRVGYGRVLAIDNGYHSVRASLRHQIHPVVAATLEAYGYVYDEPIRERTTSQVYAATLTYRARRDIELLWGGSLAQSPYAPIDAQMLVRLACAFDYSRRGESR